MDTSLVYKIGFILRLACLKDDVAGIAIPVLTILLYQYPIKMVIPRSSVSVDYLLMHECSKCKHMKVEAI